MTLESLLSASPGAKEYNRALGMNQGWRIILRVAAAGAIRVSSLMERIFLGYAVHTSLIAIKLRTIPTFSLRIVQ